MSAPDPALAVVLKRFRCRRGVTQKDLAYQADVAVATLSNTERGANNPTWTTIQAIARALDVEMDELGAAVEMEQHRTSAQANGYSREGH
jgi:transcriptional regulator with XRE-family HTH domain